MSTMAASSPTATASASENGQTVSPVEFVRGLSPEDKEDVLIALLREVIAFNGGKGLIPIETPEGESLGYYVPPEAAASRAEAVLPKLSSEREAELARRFKNPGSTITAQELIAELRAREAALQTQTP